jgi:F-type H+-transporting ATPase subunit epsilon
MPDGRAFKYSIVTPEDVLAEGEADLLVLPGQDGEFGVLYDRSPLLARLRPGIVRVHSGQNEEWYFVAGGFGDVLENQVTILTPRALRSSQVERAQAENVRRLASRMSAPDAAAQRKVLDAYAEAHALDRMLGRMKR